MQLEYLAFNIIVIAGPLVSLRLFTFTSLPRLKPMIASIGIAAFLFIVWDILVTGWFWSFNEAYITGYKFLSVPLEELLFFVTVTFACLFLWCNKPRSLEKSFSRLVPLSILLLSSWVLFHAYNNNLWYSASVFLVFSLVILLDWVSDTKLFIQRQFYIYLGMVSVLTLIFNMYLTWRPVVLYNEAVKSTITIGTIPIEDFVYGWALIGLVVVLYEWINSKQNLSPSHARQSREQK